MVLSLQQKRKLSCSIWTCNRSLWFLVFYFLPSCGVGTESKWGALGKNDIFFDELLSMLFNKQDRCFPLRKFIISWICDIFVLAYVSSDVRYRGICLVRIKVCDEIFCNFTLRYYTHCKFALAWSKKTGNLPEPPQRRARELAIARSV